VTNQIKIG